MKTGWGRQNTDIDIGLAVLASVNREGRMLTLSDIADVCGCHRSRIEQIERSAMRKLRGRLGAHREKFR